MEYNGRVNIKKKKKQWIKSQQLKVPGSFDVSFWANQSHLIRFSFSSEIRTNNTYIACITVAEFLRKMANGM